MALVKVDLEELAIALETQSGDGKFYFDTETGHIEPYMEDMDEEYAIDPDDERYLLIDPVPSYEGYNDMEAFVETVTDAHFQDVLRVAIQGKGAFRRFKDTLARDEPTLQRWYKFNNEQWRERARDWLEEQGIEYEE